MCNHRVILSLASNHEAKKNLTEAQARLCQVLSHISATEPLWTMPFGNGAGERSGHLYLNQLAWGQTALRPDELVQALKAIERRMGRCDEDRRLGVVRIDLDLLQYDARRFHLGDWERPYVRQLLNRLPTTEADGSLWE